MASLNPLTREVVFKVVFYGPGLGGKTTTLQYIHAATKPEHRGKMVSLATPMDRTLYFDFLPLRLPRVRGMSVRLQLFTVPGQVYYAATRKLVLTGADGIVFVADSQTGREDANQESLEDLITNLAEHNRGLASLPHTFHWNKRDLEDVTPIEELDRRWNPQGAPSLGTVATHGVGVFEGLERIMRMVLRAYEADLPRSDILPTSVRADTEEATIADAIRGLAESPYKPKVTPHAGMRATMLEQGLSSSLKTIPAPIPRKPGSTPALSPHLAHQSPPHAPPPGDSPEAPAADGVVSEVNDVGAAASPSGVEAGGFSFEALWNEPEREVAMDVERALARSDGPGAIRACDLLLTRVLASAASLAGNLDAPRDPGVVSLLLGLEGRRYFEFRALVRVARAGEAIAIKDALDAYVFILDARRAREVVER